MSDLRLIKAIVKIILQNLFEVTDRTLHFFLFLQKADFFVEHRLDQVNGVKLIGCVLKFAI